MTSNPSGNAAEIKVNPPPPPSPRGGVYFGRCLQEAEGWLMDAITRAKISKQLANKYVRQMEKRGQIKRIEKWPARFKFCAQSKPPSCPLPGGFTVVIKKRLFLPKAIGGLFTMLGKPKGLEYKNGLAYIDQPGVYAQFGKTAAQIWIYQSVLEGDAPKDLFESGKAQLHAVAAAIEVEHEISLELTKLYDGLEWTLNDEPASKETARNLGIGKGRGANLLIDDKLIKFDDFTDPRKLQVNPAQGAPGPVATEFVQTLYIISRNQESIKFLAEQGPQLLEKMTKAMAATADAVVSIKTGQEILVNELKRKGVL